MAAAVALAGCVHRQVETIDGDYAFVGVAVVPMDSERVLANQTVVVRGDRIVRVAPADTIALAQGVRAIDGAGRFLAPGLADMHIHLIGGDHDLPLYVASGVTLVRNMWGSPATLALRARVRGGDPLGPEIVTAGPLLDGDPPIRRGATIIRTPDEAARQVADQAAAGYDFIKVYGNLRPETFDAIAAAARRHAIPFSGHVPRTVTAAHAMRAGMASMEHLYGFKEATARPGVAVAPATFAPETIAIGRRLGEGGTNVDALFDPARMRALGALAARTGTFVTPTLVVLRQSRLPEAEIERQLRRPEMDYVTPGTRAYWTAPERRPRSVGSEDAAALGNLFQIELRQVAILNRAGARLLAGSDAPNPFVFPGVSLHEELALLVRAGLTPYEAIETATGNPARFLGRSDIGTIAVGHRADLILLAGNPLEDVARLRQPLGVMLRGRWLPEAALRQMLDGVAEPGAAMQAAPAARR